MKSIFFQLFFILSVSITAQTPLQYEAVIQLDSTLTKDNLFNRGEHWIISIFKNPQKVIQLKDKEGGQIIGKGKLEYNQTKFIWGGSELTKGYIDFTIKLYFKDGRYKYVLSDFIHEPLNGGDSFGLITTEEEFSGKISLSSKKWRQWIWDDIKYQIQTNVEVLKASLIEEMNKSQEIENKEW